MRIACPVSHLFIDDSVAELIQQSCDCLEGRDATIDLNLPVTLFHSELQITHEWSSADRDKLKQYLLSQPICELVSFHVANCYTQAPIVEGSFQPGGERLSERQMHLNAARNVAWLKGFLSDECMIAIENNNWINTPAYDLVTDPHFLAELIDKNDLYFLYDDAHARITAKGRGMNFSEYFAALPMDRCVQIHFSKYGIRHDGTFWDEHKCPSAAEMREVLTMCASISSFIRYLTIEYYKDPEHLIRANKELKTIIK